MVIHGIHSLLRKIAGLIVPPAQPWTYGPVRDTEKDQAWTLDQNEKLKQALGARGE